MTNVNEIGTMVLWFSYVGLKHSFTYKVARENLFFHFFFDSYIIS